VVGDVNDVLLRGMHPPEEDQGPDRQEPQHLAEAALGDQIAGVPPDEPATDAEEQAHDEHRQDHLQEEAVGLEG
jgi:hypothetical protein